jgi:hypothetical protein
MPVVKDVAQEGRLPTAQEPRKQSHRKDGVGCIVTVVSPLFLLCWSHPLLIFVAGACGLVCTFVAATVSRRLCWYLAHFVIVALAGMPGQYASLFAQNNIVGGKKAKEWNFVVVVVLLTQIGCAKGNSFM